jgi:hypothetical protein
LSFDVTFQKKYFAKREENDSHDYLKVPHDLEEVMAVMMIYGNTIIACHDIMMTFISISRYLHFKNSSQGNTRLINEIT